MRPKNTKEKIRITLTSTARLLAELLAKDAKNSISTIDLFDDINTSRKIELGMRHLNGPILHHNPNISSVDGRSDFYDDHQTSSLQTSLTSGFVGFD